MNKKLVICTLTLLLIVAGWIGLAVLATAQPPAATSAAWATPVTPTTWIYLPLILKNYTSPSSLNVTLSVTNPLSVARSDEPVTSGVPIPYNVRLTNLSRLRLLDGSGQPVAAQFTPLARWGGAPDNAARPVRWLLLDFQADVPANSTATYSLTQIGGTTPSYPILNVSETAEAITVQTGVTQFTVSKRDGRLSEPRMASPLIGRAIDASGKAYTTTDACPVAVTLTLAGPMRAAVQVQGAYCDASGTPLLDYTSRYWFYAGRSDVRLFHTIENNTLCPLAEYGQLDCYDIGSGGSVNVSDLSLLLSANLSGSLTYAVGGEGAPTSGNLTADLLLYQDSSGTDHWNHYPTLTDWDSNPLDTQPRLQSYVTFRGYLTTLGATTVDSGHQAAGWLRLSGSNGNLAAAVRDFWQNFPKALRAAPDGMLEIGLLPDEFGPSGYSFNLRAGEHKTHDVLLVSDSSQPAEILGASPLFAQAPTRWYVDSGALGLTALPNWTAWPDHESYITYQLDTAPSYEDWMDWYPNLPAAIEHTDFYGVWDYGDWPIDYEGYGVAPLNAKYDNNLGLWLQWARHGDGRWFDLAQAANRHLADVDILHNVHSPRHWGDGIAFGHSYHDEEGFVNPHRNYGGTHPDTAFGTAGLLLTYYLTGYDKAYQTALELADCVEYRLHNDDHLCDFFPPGTCSGEGYALGDGLYEAGSRPAANNLSIAVAAYRATADARYLTVADALVDWARPEDQPYIGGPVPGDGRAMRPWMLNMYLRALADYLEMRGEFGLPDTYQAANAFLAYADWLRTYAWLDLTPIETGSRAAYPYEWWFDGRAENNDASVNNWLLLGADALAYAHHLSGNAVYLDRAARLFRTGSRDPWFEDDANTYSSTKETANSLAYGHLFLFEWAR